MKSTTQQLDAQQRMLASVRLKADLTALLDAQPCTEMSDLDNTVKAVAKALAEFTAKQHGDKREVMALFQRTFRGVITFN